MGNFSTLNACRGTLLNTFNAYQGNSSLGFIKSGSAKKLFAFGNVTLHVRLFLLACGLFALGVNNVDAQCGGSYSAGCTATGYNIVNEGAATAVACGAYNHETGGAGAYWTLTVTSGEYYGFYWASSGCADLGNAFFVNGATYNSTSSTAPNVIQSGTTSWNIGFYKSTTTWCGTSSTLYYEAMTPTGASFNTDPATVCINTATTYSINVGSYANYYTWTASGGTLNSANGASSMSITFTSTGNQTVTCIPHNGGSGGCAGPTLSVTVAVQAASVAGSITPTVYTCGNGYLYDAATATAPAVATYPVVGGYTGSVSDWWYSSGLAVGAAGWTNWNGAGNATAPGDQAFNSGADATAFEVQITDGVCPSAYVGVSTVPVDGAMTAPTGATVAIPVGGGSTVCTGYTGNITLTASGGSGAHTGIIRWYTGGCGTTLVGTGNPLTVGAGGPGSSVTYYARYENPCGGVTTCATTTLTVVAQPVVTQNPTATNSYACELSAGNYFITISAAVSGGVPGTYAYQWFAPGSNVITGGTNLGSGSGGNTTIYTPPVTTSPGTTFYYLQITPTAGYGCNVFTSPASAGNDASLTVAPQPGVSITSQGNAQNTALCVDSALGTTLTATNTNGAGIESLQWQIYDTLDATWRNITPGNTSSTFNPNVITYTNTSTMYGGNTSTSPPQSAAEPVKWPYEVGLRIEDAWSGAGCATAYSGETYVAPYPDGPGSNGPTVAGCGSAAIFGYVAAYNAVNNDGNSQNVIYYYLGTYPGVSSFTSSPPSKVASGTDYQVPTSPTSGNYYVTVYNNTSGCNSGDDANETGYSNVAFTISPSFTITTDNPNQGPYDGYGVSCAGLSNGSITATNNATPPNYPLKFSWSTGTINSGITVDSNTVTGLAAGVYSVTINDNGGCVANGSFTLTTPASLTASTTTGTYGSGYGTDCNGDADGSATGTGAGGASTLYNYSWSPAGYTGATATNVATSTYSALPAGTYTVTVTDKNSCTASTTAVITQPSTITFTYSVSYVCDMSGYSSAAITVVPTGGASGAYQAQNNGGGYQATGALTFAGLGPGSNNTIIVRDASYNSCVSSPQTITITFPTPGTTASNCNYIYVSPSGGGILGTTGCPTDLVDALTNSAFTSGYSGGRNVLLLEQGTYNISQTLTIPANVVIDGGYNVDGNNNWYKATNTASYLDINPPLSSVTANSTTVGAYVGMIAGGNGFEMKDLTINVLTGGTSGNTNSRGNSIYGLYVTGQTGFKISRCTIQTGPAGGGAQGVYSSTTGGGSGGGGGGFAGYYNGYAVGSPTGGGNGCSSNAGSNGDAGGAGAGPYGADAGGSGGNECSSSGCNTASCDASGCTGQNGNASSAASTGTNAPATSGTPSASGGLYAYFVPVTGAVGYNGDGGGGGGGGGPGEGGTCCTCLGTCSNQPAFGGRGGDGGAGGAGGAGGYGGGGSFSIYAWGGSGTVVDCYLNPGSGGSGGQGATGHPGAQPPGNQNSGLQEGGCAGGGGGNGGAGAPGGEGGQGQQGATGLQVAIEALNGSTLAQSGSTSVPSAGTVTAYTYQGCPYSEITLTDNSAFTWSGIGSNPFFEDNKTASSSTYTSSGAGSSPIVIYYTSGSGDQNISSTSTTLSNFIRLNGTRLVTQTTGTNYIQPISTTPCPTGVNGDITLTYTSALAPFITAGDVVGYDWEIMNESAPTTVVYSSTAASPGTVAPPGGGWVPGATYQVRLRLQEGCCGWSIPMWASFTVNTLPSVASSITPTTSICPGSQVTYSTPSLASLNATGISWTVTGGTITQSGGSTYNSTGNQATILWGPTGTGTITVLPTSSCGSASSSTVQNIIIYAAPIPFITLNSPTIPALCTGSVTMTAGASSPFGGGGNGSYNYLWSATAGSSTNNNVVVTGSGTPPYITTYNVTVTDQGNQCTAIATQNITTDAQPSVAAPSPASQVVCQNGGIGSISPTSLAGGAGTFSYQWYSAASNTNSTGSATNLGSSNGAQTGSYAPPASATIGSTYYFCVITSNGQGCNQVTTPLNDAEVTIDQQSTITTPAADTEVCPGGSASMSVVAAGGAAITGYQWQYNNFGVWTNVSDNTPANVTYNNTGISSTLSLITGSGVATGTYSYQCIVYFSGSGCTAALTSGAIFTVEPQPSITSEPTDALMCLGGNSTLQVVTTGGVNPAYTWTYWGGASYQAIAPNTPSGITYSGVNSNTLAIAASNTAQNGDFYYQVNVTYVAGTGCTPLSLTSYSYPVYNTYGVAVVALQPSILTQPSSVSPLCGGTEASFTSDGVNGASPFNQWQYFVGGSWQNVLDNGITGITYGGSNTSNTLDVSAANTTAPGVYQYRMQFSSLGSNCITTYSNTVTATIFTTPTLSSATSEIVCSSSPFSYTGTSATGGTSFSWTRAAVAGISNSAGSGGSANISETLVNTTTSPINVTYVFSMSANGCPNTENVVVQVNPLPNVYTVTGGTNCGSTTVGISSTDAGVTYQLYDGATAVGSPAIGYGGVRTFGAQTAAGTYTVIATITASECTATMSGSAVVYADPTVYAVGGGTNCGSATVTLASSDNGINYQLQNDGNAVGPVVPGTTNSLNFGLQTAAGTYTVLATNPITNCVSLMGGSSTVNANPNVYNVTGGTNCGATTVGVSGTDAGVSYQLYNGVTAVGAPIIGNGIPRSFGSQTAAGTYTVIGTSGPGCTTVMNGSAVVNANPTLYTVGGGTNCGSSTVTLSGSDNGINYQLYNGASPVGPVVPGNGSGLTFGVESAAGTYTVAATNPSTGCLLLMSGSSIVNANPAVFNVTGGTNCGATTVGISGSTAGVYYQLYNGATPVGPAVNGTGLARTFGSQTAAGTYTVVATIVSSNCSLPMNGSAVVNANPTVYAVGGGTNCGSSTVTLAGSDNGVNYQLYLSGTATGPVVPGTSNSLTFGVESAAGTYTVVGTNVTTGCTSNMSGSSIVEAVPAIYTVTGGANCGTTTIGLSSSQAGVYYQLYNGVNQVVGAFRYGTGNAITFGAQTAAGTYTVVATLQSSTCTETMTGTATVYPGPTVYAVGGGTNCGSSTVTLAGSDNGVNYQLYLGINATGPVVPGTGNSLTFGVESAPGTYTVIATNTTSGCSSAMSGSSIVNATPNVYNVTGGTNCGTTTIGVSFSDAGVSYQLYNGATPVVGAQRFGTGSGAITFGAISVAGTYTVVATIQATACTATMNGTAVVNPGPTLYTVGGGTNCGSSTVTLSNSDVGINYQLYNGVNAVGPVVPGIPGSLNFGLQSAAGTYTVVGTNTSTGCHSTMSGSSIVEATPTVYNVTGGANCGTTTIGVSFSDAGVYYQLYNGANAVVGALRYGTGSGPITFSAITVAGTYTVQAVVVATSCTAAMSGTATVYLNPLQYTVGGGTNCASSTVTLSGSQATINYQLYVGATPVGPVVPGTGSSLNFGTQSTVGTYTVVATNTGATCTQTMTGSSVVSGNITPVVTIAITAGSQNSCTGVPVTFTATPTSGGSLPEYAWQINGITVQSGSSPTMTVTSLTNGALVTVNMTSNASCASPATVTSNSIDMGVNPLPTFTATPVNTSCNGTTDGQITVAVTVGTSPYTYSINAGVTYPYSASPVTGLATGSYHVDVKDANGCISSGSATVVVGQPAVVVAHATNTGPYGLTQTIQLDGSGTGGTNTYTYMWSGPALPSSLLQDPTIVNAEVTMTGAYDVTVTDGHGCSATASTNVTVLSTTVFTWIGTTNTNWTVSSNWSPPSPAGGPNSCAANVIIPDTINQPTIPVSTPITVGNIQINSSAVLTLNSNMNVCDDWTGGSAGNAFILGNGIVMLTGSANQTIAGATQFDELLLNNTLNATMQDGSYVGIATALDLQSGEFDAALGNLTFTSASVTQIGILDNFSAGYTGTLNQPNGVTAQRFYLASYTYNQHFMGSPINNVPLSQFGFSGTGGFVTPKSDCDESAMALGSAYGSVFSYHENPRLDLIVGSGYPANSTIVTCGEAEWYVETGNHPNAVDGMGYSILKPGGGTISLNGTVNLNSSYVVSGYTPNTMTNSNWQNTSMQGRDIRSGWQLISNPYLATLKVGIDPSNSGFDYQIQVWNTDGGNAGTYQPYMAGDDALIPPFQAFMVHKTAVGGSANYTLNASDRVRTQATFFAQNDNELDIVAQNISTGLLDRTMVAFNSDATDGFDVKYDADKFGGSLNRHTLYTLNNNKWMARNVLNSINTTSTVAMGFEPGATGNYAFTFNNLSTFDPTTYIFLEDKQAHVMYNVRNGNYLFSADSADDWNRFVLHFTPPVKIASENATCTSLGSINIVQPGTANWNYTITNANNATVASGVLNESSPITVSAQYGTYTLKLTDNNNYTVTKQILVGGDVTTIAGINGPATAASQTPVTFTSTSQGGTDYTWYFSDGSIITGTEQATYTFTQPGTYTVMLVVTSKSGCSSSFTQTIVISNPTGLSNITGGGDLNMWSYGNMVYVDFSQEPKVDAVIKIYNILGQEISNEEYTLNSIYKKEIDNIDAAYVIVSVKNEDNITTRKLFIINPK